MNVIVMGHGGYAEGVKNNLSMITGVPDYMYFVDLNKEDDLSDLDNKVRELLEKIGDKQVLFACDLVGASPFRIAAMLTAENTEKYCTVAGLNTMALMELAMSSEEEEAKKSAERAVKTTKESVERFPE